MKATMTASLFSIVSIGSRFQRGLAWTSSSIRASKRFSSTFSKRGFLAKNLPQPTSSLFLSYYALLFSVAAAAGGSSSLVYCASTTTTDTMEMEDSLKVPPFDESSLSFDHYNGVVLHLDKINANGNDHSVVSFEQDLQQALLFWKAEGRKGIWIHAPSSMAKFVPVRESERVCLLYIYRICRKISI
jgi:hypothetical protein